MQLLLERTGTRFECLPRETILAAAARQGIWLPSACRSGTCGSCKARVTSGDVEHDARAKALTPIDRQTGIALLCCAYARSDVSLDIAELADRPDIDRPPRPARVVRLERLAPDVMGLTLRLPPNDGIAFVPGQFVGISWADGGLRSFSIANAPRADGTIDLQVGRVPGGAFTRHVFEEMSVNSIVRLSGPFGTFRLSQSRRPIIFVAGGTGMAPIWSMLEAIAAAPRPEPIRIYWGNRTPEGFYMADRLRSMRERLADFDHIPVVSEPGGQWSGRRGLVHAAVLDDYEDLSRFDVYACGNPQMVEAAQAGFARRRLPADRFFADSFHCSR